MAGLYFEEFTPGQVFEHAWTRTVTEMDNMLFSMLTMNPQPLHIDAHFAAGTEFGRPLVNSLFTLGLMIGMSVNDTTLGTTIANLGMSDGRISQARIPGRHHARARPKSSASGRANRVRTRVSSNSATGRSIRMAWRSRRACARHSCAGDRVERLASHDDSVPFAVPEFLAPGLGVTLQLVLLDLLARGLGQCVDE